MREGDRQGAVPGVTVHADGSFTVNTPDAIRFYQLHALLGAVKLEAKGLKFRGGSRTALAKRRFGIKGKRPAVIAWLEAHIESERARLNLK